MLRGLALALLAVAATLLFGACATSKRVATVHPKASPPRLPPLRLVRCPRDPVDNVPSLDDAVKAIRRLRVRGRYVIAQGRVKLTQQNSPIYTAFSLYASSFNSAERYRALVRGRCGLRTVVASWLFELSFPTLLAGSGDTPYIIARTYAGWTVVAEPSNHG